jgi:predicted Zn finger-like uncharacterized protein
MLTRCPQCATVFRVSTEQLQARQGKVRCGHCANVFNALDALLDTEAQSNKDTEHAALADTYAKPMAEAHAEPYFTPESESELEEDLDFTAISDDEERESIIEALEEPPRSRRLAAWLWAFGALIMLAVLVAHAAYQFRGELAARYPELRPHLSAMCSNLECEIPLPRKSELVSIEGSDLHPEGAQKNRLALAATIRNNAPYAQAYPYLELTLTDRRDQALARRVFQPRDYLRAGADVAAGIAANSDVAISMMIEVRDLEASGYRIYVFYP